MMRSFHDAALAAVAAIGFASAATAADLPVKAPIAAAPAPTWTGFYVGGNFGGAWGHFSNTYGAPPPPAPPGFFADDAAAISANGSSKLNPSGLAIGVQAGYNYQIDRTVIGIEADFGYFGLNGSAGGAFPTPGAGVQTSSTSVDTSWLLTVRPRLGVTLGQTLFYATGGLAVARVKLDETNIFDPAASEAGTDILSVSRTQVGWTAGGGVEHRLDARWSIKGEILYLDLGRLNATSSTKSPFVGDPTPVFYSHSLSSTAEIARVGFNYKLN